MIIGDDQCQPALTLPYTCVQPADAKIDSAKHMPKCHVHRHVHRHGKHRHVHHHGKQTTGMQQFNEATYSNQSVAIVMATEQ